MVVETKSGGKSTAQTVDNNDGTYKICFVPQEVVETKLSVFVNGHEIKPSL